MRYLILSIVFLCACRREAPPVEVAAVPPPSPAPAVEEAPVPPELASWSWSSISVAAGTVAQVRQVPSSKGHCRVSASVGSEKLWSVEGCLAAAGDLRFVSPDAAALVVVKQHPDVNEGDFGSVYRKGARVASLTVTSLHLPGTVTHAEGYTLTWLGTRDPREMPDGVELQLRDGSSLTVGFDGHVAAPAGPAVAATAPASPAPAIEACSPCSYTDADGVYHLVDNVDEVPPQYRRVAGRIRGSIQHEVVVQHDWTASPPSTEYSTDYQAPSPQQQPPKASGEPGGAARNERGENGLQYATRIGQEAINARYGVGTAAPLKCIDNSGKEVSCKDAGYTR